MSARPKASTAAAPPRARTKPAGTSGAARAVAYLRVSTNDQARRNGEVEGYSLPAQRAAVERKVQTLDAVVIEEFVEGGHTATNTQRAELQRMLTFIETEHVDYVVVHKLDRLIRNRFDDLLITVALDKAGT
jgi:site-specific DNA recombinase